MIEHLILSGGHNVLKNIKGLLIKLPGIWVEQNVICENLPLNSGLKKSKIIHCILNLTLMLLQIKTGLEITI